MLSIVLALVGAAAALLLGFEVHPFGADANLLTAVGIGATAVAVLVARV